MRFLTREVPLYATNGGLQTVDQLRVYRVPETLLNRWTRFQRRMERDWYNIAEQPAPAPHLTHPEGCAALRIVLVTEPRDSRSCEHFPDGFDLHLLRGAVIQGEGFVNSQVSGGGDQISRNFSAPRFLSSKKIQRIEVPPEF